MANFIDIKFLGSRRLNRKLNKLQNSVKTKIMRNAAKKAMIPVLQLAIRRSPKGETGKLSRGIKIAVFRGKQNVGAVVQTGTARSLGLGQDGQYYYPAAHEYGTREQPAIPFMRSALADRRSQAIGILRAEIKKMIRKV